ncbi:peroxiredoxin [Chitinophaga skermanii]|uniref:Peroxiredoxin n=1 Tax=Chitinophaga skermanii TaxID=331697 RepID=A0A327QY21_9BACT|nr:TlpA disulfide reductase family protein [Chitinophaga skermanii]RAJ08648.1 peroxiredoxin [Chitinophaga skermanii]
MKQLLLFVLLVTALHSNAQNKTLAVGDQAPAISLLQPSGKTLQLSDLHGKIVLIDFWASWCLPCVKEQPLLKAIYKKHANSGRFEILGVSLDSKKENWEKSIQRLGITWPQVSDLKFWNSVPARDYGVEELPFNVVVNEEGKIIAINLHDKALEQFLDQQLTNK